MRSQHGIVGLSFAALVAVVFLIAPVVGQMDHGQVGQGGGQQMPGMQGMSSSTMAANQMMRSIDTMMTNSGAMMRDFTTTHQGMGGHQPFVGSMQGMFDQMRQVHDGMKDMMTDPGFRRDDSAMKAFRQAGQDFQQMGKAFDSMLKNMNQAMKGIPR